MSKRAASVSNSFQATRRPAPVPVTREQMIERAAKANGIPVPKGVDLSWGGGSSRSTPSSAPLTEEEARLRNRAPVSATLEKAIRYHRQVLIRCREDIRAAGEALDAAILAEAL